MRTHEPKGEISFTESIPRVYYNFRDPGTAEIMRRVGKNLPGHPEGTISETASSNEDLTIRKLIAV